MFAANNQGTTLSVISTGTTVPMPDLKNLATFTTNATSTVFTVPETGRYLVFYRVTLTAAVILSTGVYLNGILIPASQITPSVATTLYEDTFIVNLTEGDELALTLFGYTGSVSLAAGVGAMLELIRLD